MRIDIVTIHPGLFGPFLDEAMVGIARRRGALEVAVHDLRDWTHDRHRTVDDAPYGGGPGMVMKPEPLVEAIEALAGPKPPEAAVGPMAMGQEAGPAGEAAEAGAGRRARVVLLAPSGRRLDQALLEDLARSRHLVLVCGRYEGVDQRAIDVAVDEEVSIGDYVLSGGEVPAMVLVEGIARLLPGVLGNPESAAAESFGRERRELLEGPQYTRPAVYRGREVPEVLRSGHHAEVERWREAQARARTRERRPDLRAGARREEER